MVENQLDKSITDLRTDHEHEYMFELFKNLYDEKEIKRQLTMLSIL
jgi:hypothetical protein